MSNESRRVRLTDAVVARAVLPEGKADAVIWDTDLTGFGLRLRPGGTSWIVAYRPVGTGRTGQFKRLKLGTPKTVTTATEARALARTVLGRIAAGADPLADRRAQRTAERAKLSDVLDRYEADLRRRNFVNTKWTMSGLRLRLDRFMGRAITDITGADLAKIIEDLEAAGKPGAAKDFRSRARAFFSWVVTKARLLPSNPLAGHRKERATKADRLAVEDRGRALTDAELVKAWNAADPATVFGRYVRFLILTGCRRAEGFGVSWLMVDQQQAVIRFPAAFMKQGREHDVPISPELAALLKACRPDARSDLIFPSWKTGGLMSGHTQLLAKLLAAADVDFRFHDLRRTFRTGLSRLGVDSDTAELALGHARVGLLGVYNKDRAEDPLRIAFNKWGAHVAAIVRADAEKRVATGEGVFG